MPSTYLSQFSEALQDIALNEAEHATFHKTCINQEEAFSLSTLLAKNSSLRSIHLHENEITTKGAMTIIAEILFSSHSSIRIMDFSRNKIEFPGWNLGSLVLQSNGSLQTLILDKNNIDDEIIVKVLDGVGKSSFPKLQVIYLRNNLISDTGVQKIAKALAYNSTITALNLSHNKITGNGMQELNIALKSNQTLSTLVLSHNPIGDEGATILSKSLSITGNTTLRKLNLEYTEMSDSGCLALVKKMNFIVNLNLSGNNIGKDGAQSLGKALAKGSSLRVLELKHTQLRDDGILFIAEALCSNTCLQTLNISYANIGKEGMRSLSKMIKSNITLEYLNLMGNNIDSEGAEFLAQYLKHNCTLKTLNLSKTNIGISGMVKLNEALKKNKGLTTLNIRNNGRSFQSFHNPMNCIGENKMLTTLIMDANVSEITKALEENRKRLCVKYFQNAYRFWDIVYLDHGHSEILAEKTGRDLSEIERNIITAKQSMTHYAIRLIWEKMLLKRQRQGKPRTQYAPLYNRKDEYSPNIFVLPELEVSLIAKYLSFRKDLSFISYIKPRIQFNCSENRMEQT